MQKLRIFAALCLSAGLFAGSALAQEQNASPICTNSGNSYKVGEFACIAACHGARRLARCDVVLERATWTYVSEVCPSAILVPGPPATATQIPVVAAMTPLPGPLRISEIGPELSPLLASLRND